MDRKREFLARVYTVLSVFAVAAIALIVKAAMIHMGEGKELRKKSKDLYYTVESVEAERGRILADDGSPLATSQPIFELRMDMKASGLKPELFYQKLDSLAHALQSYLYQTKSKDEIKAWLKQAYKKGNRFLFIAKGLNYEQMSTIKEFPLFSLGPNTGGLIIKSETRRIKPFQHFASRTIGLDRKNADPIGLEKSFDEYLKGKVGHRVTRKAGPNLYLPVSGLEEILPQKGMDVNSTINTGIQEVAELALEDAIRNHHAESGCAIVMEVETGAIKAIANLGWNENLELVEDYNYAVANSTEPGSTFKLASLLALLEIAGVDTSAGVDLQGGSCRFYDRNMYDSKMHGIHYKDLAYSFIQSSNVGISKLVNEHFSKNPKEFVDYLKKLGIHQKTNIEIDGEPVPIIKDPKRNKNIWYGTSLPWMAVGYELQLTPLQILCIYNTVANGGIRVQPRLVDQISDGYKTVRKYTPKVAHDTVISEKNLKIAQALMHAVVDRGTAKNIYTEMYEIAGKTGTAVTNYFHKDAANKTYQASFAGYFPADNPIYSCIVVIYNPQSSAYYGSEVAAPVFRKIADRCMRAEFSKKAVLNTEPKVALASERMPVGNKGMQDDFERLFQFIGLPYKPSNSNVWVETYTGSEGIDVHEQIFEANVMPDLTGMGLRDASYLMDAYKAKLLPRGNGKIIYQNVPPGSIVKGPIVEIILN
ncbi:MAG: transpeptidase family protein [Saprospiraceae bacterium]|nr:transpeptidase family protein [Saprospiraceae bacterium]